MGKKALTIRIAGAILIFTLIMLTVLPVFAYAADSSELSVDVWTGKGGQGYGKDGGIYYSGEEVALYFKANFDCQGKYTVSGPSPTVSGTVNLIKEQEYKMSMGNQILPGQWRLVLQASAIGQFASDMTAWVVMSEPAPVTTIPPVTTKPPITTTPAAPPPTIPATPPAATTTPPVQPTLPVIKTKVDATNATELDALMALKMAEGSLPVNLNLDANGDGKITKDDAASILTWSVTGYGGAVSAAQQEIADSFGFPSLFMVSYLLDSSTEYDSLVRTETWFYPEHQKKITFVGGDIYSAEDFTISIPSGASYSTLKPYDINYFTTPKQLSAKIGGDIAEIEALPDVFMENNMHAYLGKNVTFIMADDHLSFLQTLITEPEKTSGLNLNLSKFFSLIYPEPVYARGLFHAIKRGVNFVLRLPDKVANKVLPHQLAPIGSAILSAHLGHIPAIKIASRANNIITLNDNLRAARNTYRNEANKLNFTVEALKAEKNRLDQGPTALGISAYDWADRKKSINTLIPALENATSKLNRAADNLSVEGLTRIALQNQINNSLGNVKSIVAGEVGNEIRNLTNAGAIYTFLSASGGKNPGSIIDSFIEGDIGRSLGNKGSDKNLVDRIKQNIKNQLKNDADNVRRNWQQVLENTIAQVQGQGDKALATATSLATTKPTATTKPPATTTPATTSKPTTTTTPATTSAEEQDKLAGNWDMTRGSFKFPVSVSNDALRRVVNTAVDQVIPTGCAWEILRSNNNDLQIKYKNQGLNLYFLMDKDTTWFRDLIGTWGQASVNATENPGGQSCTFQMSNSFSSGGIPGIDAKNIKATFNSKVNINVTGNKMTATISVENIRGTYSGKREDNKEWITKQISIPNFSIPYIGIRK